MWFVVGHITCMLKGKAGDFAMLVAQAQMETTNFQSRAWRFGSGAWCMHYSPTGTKRANGQYITAPVDGRTETLAKYTGPFSMVRMWLDRIDWDRNNGVRTGQLPKQYADDVLRNWQGPNASADTKARYVKGWLDVFAKEPKLLRVLGSNEPLFGLPGWVWLLIATASLTAIWWFFLRKRK